jgi:phage gp45-like
MTRISPRLHKERAGRLASAIQNLCRRMAVTLSGGGLWQLSGYAKEAPLPDVPVFSGIGFASRPEPGSDAEAIVLKVGAASGHPVIIAMRDESVRMELSEDETAIFNGQCVVHCRADGTVAISSRGGTSVPLATKADLDALAAMVESHTHPDPASGFTGAPVEPVPTAAGTTVLRGQ